VIPPKHDRLTGENVLPITGSPHRVTATRLDSEYEKFQDQIDALPRPRVAVLLGGKSRAFDLSALRAAEMAHQIQLPLEQEGGSLLMTFSRRTPEQAKALLTARLRHLPGIIWDGAGANPYFAFLAAADYILVTEDSTNMATEAASTGKPVFILKMDGTSLKFRLFHQELERMGAARPYGGGSTAGPMIPSTRPAARRPRWWRGWTRGAKARQTLKANRSLLMASSAWEPSLPFRSSPTMFCAGWRTEHGSDPLYGADVPGWRGPDGRRLLGRR
jgi:hypothetical protein